MLGLPPSLVLVFIRYLGAITNGMLAFSVNLNAGMFDMSVNKIYLFVQLLYLFCLFRQKCIVLRMSKLMKS